MIDQKALSTPTAGRLARLHRSVNWPYYALLILWAIITIFIFLWLVESSFKTNNEVFGSAFELPSTPLQAAAANFEKAWAVSHMSVYFLNSVIVVVATVFLVTVLSAPAAYVLSRTSFLGNTLVSYYFIAGMGLPYQLILIPLYALLTKLHIIDSLPGLILTYVAISIPFTVLLLTGFFRTLPTELEDAAAIDGCSEFGIFWRVMLPLAGPGLFTSAIFNFIYIWNEYLLALFIINRDELRTLPLGIMNIRYSMQFTADWAGMFAAVVLAIIVPILAFLFLSERIMTGLTLGAGR